MKARETTEKELREITASIASFKLEAQACIAKGDYDGARKMDKEIADLTVDANFRNQRLTQITVEERAGGIRGAEKAHSASRNPGDEVRNGQRRERRSRPPGL